MASAFLALAALLLPGACGGGGSSAGSSPPSAQPTASSPPPSSGAPNPCAAVAQAVLLDTTAAPASPKVHGGLGHDKRHLLDSLWNHRTRGGVSTQDLRALAAEDVGDIAVIRDDGSVVIPANPLDLRGRGLRFQANAGGGYDVASTDGTFRASLGERVSLGDDATQRVEVPFAFPFFGGTQSAAFVNSDGNVTFGEGDTATDQRGLGRLLGGAPRVAPFFADLDPSVGGGVFVQAAADAFTVTWCAVPGFDSSDKVTAQATLLPDGSVEMNLADTTTLADGIVALSPGRTDSFTAVDLSAPGPTPGGAAAVGERFAAQAELDDVMLARNFYQTHADDYDQLIVFGDGRLISGQGSFAFELTVKNDIQGIGVPAFDAAGEYGSQGRLASVVVMDNLGKYPDNPSARIPRLGEDSTLSILGQESGHRWLAALRFRDANGQVSDALLGRDRVHWSFFFDSDASVMEGNDIEDQGGGSFRTVGAVSRYCLLDLYAMGVVEEAEVSPVFFVESPAGTSQDRDSEPQTGVTFTGTRRNVTIQDIVSAMGPRRPPAAASPRLHRQAFVYVLRAGRTTDPTAEIQKLERIRAAWEPFFTQATGNRMVLDAHLR